MPGRLASAAVFLAVMLVGGTLLLSDIVQVGALHPLSVVIAASSAGDCSVCSASRSPTTNTYSWRQAAPYG